MMGGERIMKVESDIEIFLVFMGCSWFYFFVFVGGRRVECDWKVKLYFMVKFVVNVKVSG